MTVKKLRANVSVKGILMGVQVTRIKKGDFFKMQKAVEVLVKILGENAEAYKIESEDNNILWLSKKVIANDDGGVIGTTVVMDVVEVFAVRNNLD